MKAYRTDLGLHACWYVAQLPGQGGKDWGYTMDVKQALDLSPYWVRRFRAYCNHLGQHAQYVGQEGTSER